LRQKRKRKTNAANKLKDTEIAITPSIYQFDIEFVKSYYLSYRMLETPHVVVGAAIATKVVNPALSIPLALGSHFLLEKIPHWNPHLNRETEKYGQPTKKSTQIVIADATTALVFGSFVAYQALPNTGHAIGILATCLASVLPDLIEAPYFFLHIRKEAIKKWIKFQKSLQADAPLSWGILTQLVVIAVGAWWIFG